MDATCSLPLAQAVTGCDQCNGRVLARCSSSRASLPWWGIALVVVCTLLCAMVLALGAAVAYLLHSRHRQSRAMHSYQPVEVSLQTQEAAPSANTAALVDFDAVKE
jgi:O-antigen ligase